VTIMGDDEADGGSMRPIVCSVQNLLSHPRTLPSTRIMFAFGGRQQLSVTEGIVVNQRNIYIFSQPQLSGQKFV